MNTLYNNKAYRSAELGFTLIELSIVLVIIGLIVGGILVGQDLIKGAEIRATISQIEKYNTSVNTFRNKYNGIPGDLAVNSASQFGLYSNMSGAQYNGDGDGLVEGGATTQTSAGILGTAETLVFWRHLSDAGYVDGSFGQTGLSSGALAAACTTTTACNAYIPTAKLGRGNMVFVNSAAGINYFGIAGIANIQTSGSYATTGNTDNMTPLEAYNIDKKVDDGFPDSGSVQAIDMTSANTPSANFLNSTQLANCGSATAYNVAGTFGTTQSCALRLRFN